MRTFAIQLNLSVAEAEAFAKELHNFSWQFDHGEVKRALAWVERLRGAAILGVVQLSVNSPLDARLVLRFYPGLPVVQRRLLEVAAMQDPFVEK